VLTCATDTGSGGYTHRYFRAPTSADDLVAARDRRLDPPDLRLDGSLARLNRFLKKSR